MRTKITFFIATVTLLFSVTTTSAQTNLFTNPSFEDTELTTHEDDGSWRMLEIYTEPFELLYFNDGAISKAVIDTYSSDGNQAVAVTWGDDNNMPADFIGYRLDQQFDIEGGKSYNFNFDALTDGEDVEFLIYVEYYYYLDGVLTYITDTGAMGDRRYFKTLEGEDYAGVNGGAGEVYTSPANATRVITGIQAFKAPGTDVTDGTVTLLDNFSFTEAAAPVVDDNVMKNGSFEDTGFSDYRMLEIYDGGVLKHFNNDAASTAAISTNASEGAQSMAVTWGDNSGMAGFLDYRLDQNVAVEENKSYNFNLDALTEGRNINLGLYLEWSGAGGPISDTHGENYVLELSEGAAYTSVNGGEGKVYVAPAGATVCTVGIKARYDDGGVAIDGTVTLIDNWSFTKEDELSTDSRAILDFSVYPNPATNIINIQAKSAIANIQLFNSVGQKVADVDGKSSIDISSLNTGLYVLKATDAEGNTGVKRVVKQ